MGATVLSKVLGLLREMLLASAYGAGNPQAEAFSAALTVPSAFFDILFSAAILGCFIPVYNSFKGDGAEADRFACTSNKSDIPCRAVVNAFCTLFSWYDSLHTWKLNNKVM